MDIFALALQMTAQGVDKVLGGLGMVDDKGKKTEVTMKRMTGVVKGLWAAFTVGAAAIAMRALFNATAEGQRSVEELSATVENAGEKWKDWEAAMEGAATKLQTTTRFGDEEVRAALSNMITLTDDVALSYENIGLAADIAAKRHISLEEASTLVAKTLNGQFGALGRLGIKVDSVSEGMATLRKRFGGFAEQEGQSMSGQLARIQNAFGEVLEELGNAIFGMGGFGNALEGVIEWLGAFQGWIARNTGDIRRFLTAVGQLGGIIWDVLVVAFKAWVEWTRDLYEWEARLVARTMEIPARFKATFGSILESIGEFAAGGAAFLDKWFGTGFATKVQDSVTLVGAQMVEDAEARLKEIRENAEDTIDLIRNFGKRVGNETAAAATPAPAGRAPRGSGRKSTFRPGEEIELEGIEGKLKKVAPPEVRVPVIVIPEIKSEFSDQVLDLLSDLDGQFEMLSENLADVFISGFVTAFESGFKDAGKVVLRGLGQILTSMGMNLMKTGAAMIGLLPALSNPFTSGPAMLAAGALIAGLGAALGAAATGGRGGRGSGRSGGGNRAARPEDITSTTLYPTNAVGGGSVEARPIQNITIIGPNDPRAQREIRQLIANGDRRNLK